MAGPWDDHRRSRLSNINRGPHASSGHPWNGPDSQNRSSLAGQNCFQYGHSSSWAPHSRQCAGKHQNVCTNVWQAAEGVAWLQRVSVQQLQSLTEKQPTGYKTCGIMWHRLPLFEDCHVITCLTFSLSAFRFCFHMWHMRHLQRSATALVALHRSGREPSESRPDDIHWDGVLGGRDLAKTPTLEDRGASVELMVDGHVCVCAGWASRCCEQVVPARLSTVDRLSTGPQCCLYLVVFSHKESSQSRQWTARSVNGDVRYAHMAWS